MTRTWTATAKVFDGHIDIAENAVGDLPTDGATGPALNRIVIEGGWGEDDDLNPKADAALAEWGLTRIGPWSDDDEATCEVAYAS